MKRLLLLLLKIVIFFYSTPAAVSAADATINLSLKYGKCDGNQPLAAGGNIVQLGPEKWLLVVADKATGQIDYVQPLSHPTENIDGDFSWTLVRFPSFFDPGSIWIPCRRTRKISLAARFSFGRAKSSYGALAEIVRVRARDH